MSEVVLTIDGREVKAKAGTTILEAARSVGIEISTLCQHEKLAPYGACRICTVEIVRGQRSRLVASCVYQVEDGLVVKTESAPVVKGRRMLLELILARWQIDKVKLDHWPWTGEALLKRYGLERSRFAEDTTMCILCGLCVRYCAEVKKENVLGFVGRGTKRQVVIYPELAEEACPSCDGGEMGCRSVCPTGVVPNDYALAGQRFGKKPPLAHPVRVHDEDNVRDILRVVGHS